MNTLEINEESLKPFITVRYPNGASRVFSVSVEQHWGDFRLTLMNDDGETVFESDWEMILSQATLDRSYAECAEFLKTMTI